MSVDDELFSPSLAKRIARLRAKRLTSELFVWPRQAPFRREPSKNELAPHKRNVFLCVHGNHYFLPCKLCKRSEAEAKLWEKMWMKI